MDFEEYTEEAMATNHWPRLFTESQVMDMLRHSASYPKVPESVIIDDFAEPFNDIIYPALGLAGETGEVLEKIKKIIRDDDGEMSPKKAEGIGAELGDVLWFVTAAAGAIKTRLSDVAEGNLTKLASRAARGVLKGSGDER